MTHISTITVGAGGAASIDFTSIPQTGTDLVILYSARSTTTVMEVWFNGSNSSATGRQLRGSGSAASSVSFISPLTTNTTDTASTFANGQFYIPNYTGSANKAFSVDVVTENNATAAWQSINAATTSVTAALTSISLKAGGSDTISQYSTFSLYTITKGSGGATVS